MTCVDDGDGDHHDMVIVDDDDDDGDQHDMLVIVDDDDASKQGYQKKVGESDYLYPSLEYK